MACLALVFTVLLIFKSHCLITFRVQTLEALDNFRSCILAS